MVRFNFRYLTAFIPALGTHTTLSNNVTTLRNETDSYWNYWKTFGHAAKHHVNRMSSYLSFTPNSTTRTIGHVLESKASEEKTPEKQIRPSDESKQNESESSPSSPSNAELESDMEHLHQRRRKSQSYINPANLSASENYHVACQPSILSSESPTYNFRGLYNLAGIMLFAMNIRLVIENLRKYGLLIHFNILSALRDDWARTWPCLLISTYVMLVSPIFAHLYEVLAARRILSPSATLCFHTLHVLIVFFVPQFIILFTSSSVIASLLLLLVVVVVSMKLISHAHVCHDLRSKLLISQHIPSGAHKKKILDSMNNELNSTEDRPGGTTSTTTNGAINRDLLPEVYKPSLFHLYYFMAAPTLIFQLSYPRSKRIRRLFLMRRIIEFIFCSVLQWFIIEQYVMPTVRNSVPIFNRPFSFHKVVFIFERVLKLAIPNGIVWLLMFYSLFHAYLNILGELLRFGDRLFYRDWWNAETLDVYWRNWNLPVHNWLVRHCYAPLIRAKFSTFKAQTLTFLVSAILHENLVSVPLQTLSFYAFLGMCGQIPLIAISKHLTHHLKRPVWGNVLFWVSFLMFGQPLIILLYAHGYEARYGQGSIN